MDLEEHIICRDPKIANHSVYMNKIKSKNKYRIFKKIQEHLSSGFPLFLNAKDVTECRHFVSCNFIRGSYISVYDKENRRYRIKEDSLLELFKGKTIFEVVHKYGLFYLE